MLRGSPTVERLEKDYAFEQVDIFKRPGFPRLHFIENRYSRDPTNWWIPNRACMEAMLRSSGFRIMMHPEPEVYICRLTENNDEMIRAVYPAGRKRPS
jgi:tRNA (mo5U34)-methyltransferase